jgi:hypothetical protein
MAAAYVATGDSFVVAQKPKLWSESRLEAGNRNGIYDLLMPADERRTGAQFVFLENFFDDLRRRVPLK